MENSKELAKRLTDLFLDGKWIANTNYKEQLSGISLKTATTQISDLNTIAKLTFHINYYLDGILNVFNGGNLEIRDKYSFDLPELKTEEHWENLVNELLKNAQLFINHVANFSNDQLAAPFVKSEYGNYRRNIEGVIEHAYYHLGQLVLIKKMLYARDKQ